MELGVEIEPDRNGWAVVVVRGDVDVASAPRLHDDLVALISGGSQRVVLDLDDVDFLDSFGLGVVIGALKRARSHGGDLLIVCNRPRLLDLFVLTNLTRVFAIHPSIDEAVAA